MRSLCIVSLLAFVAPLAALAPAHADPVEVAPGKAVLPLTGLSIVLPKDKRKGASWALSGSWSYSDGGKSFDARDVIDLKVDGKIVAGTWVHVGYFNAGDCATVVNGLAVPDRWTAERDLWGQHWNIAGGTWDFGNDLGKVPAVAMCVPRPDRASLLLYHFFVAEPTLDQAASLAALAKEPLLANITSAWSKDKSAPVQPLTRPEIKRRGDIEAHRSVRLERVALDVMLPDDGCAWIVRMPEADAASDFLDRMAPAAPDVSIEVARMPGTGCDELFADGPGAPEKKAEPAPKNVPAGWRSLGTLVTGTTLERVICRDMNDTALVVGLLATPNTTPEGRDFGPFLPLIAALATASDAAPTP